MKWDRAGSLRPVLLLPDRPLLWKIQGLFFSVLLSSLELSHANIYEPKIRALLGTAAHFCEVVVLCFCPIRFYSHHERPPLPNLASGFSKGVQHACGIWEGGAFMIRQKLWERARSLLASRPDVSQLDKPEFQYRSVNFGARKSKIAPNCAERIESWRVLAINAP